QGARRHRVRTHEPVGTVARGPGGGDRSLVVVARRDVMTAARTDTPPGIEDVMALSPLQEGLYSLTTLAEFAEGEAADDPYLIGMAADISGTLDVDLLRDCAAKMLIRHPNLRAGFFIWGIACAVQIWHSRLDLQHRG